MCSRTVRPLAIGSTDWLGLLAAIEVSKSELPELWRASTLKVVEAGKKTL